MESKKTKISKKKSTTTETGIPEPTQGSDKELKTPIAKTDITVNVGSIIKLVKGQPLPAEIDQKFYSSFKTKGII